MASQLPTKTIVDRLNLASPQSWTDGKTTIVVPGSETAPAKIESVDVKTVYYKSQALGITLALLSNPATGWTYVVQGDQSFYVVRSRDLISCLVGIGDLIVRDSIFKVETPPQGDRDVLARFVAEVDDMKMLALSRQSVRIDMAAGVPTPFWTARGGLDQQPAQPTLKGVDLRGDMLHLDLVGGGHYTGAFWVDIRRNRLARTEIDGKEVFVEK